MRKNYYPIKTEPAIPISGSWYAAIIMMKEIFSVPVEG